MTSLSVRDLTVPGRLHRVSFALRAGTVTAVVGPNGTGKSTLLQAAAGLLRASGQIEWGGIPIERISVLDRGRRLAWVAQEAQFPFGFSVRDVVAQGRYMWGDDGNGIEAALAALDLRDLAGRPVTRLSGGERHRVSLARALATGARLQLWDEPIAQLDVRHALEVSTLAQRVMVPAVFADQAEPFRRRRRRLRHGSSLVGSVTDAEFVALDLDPGAVFEPVVHDQLVADGPPDRVLTPESIFEVFGVCARRSMSLELELPHG